MNKLIFYIIVLLFGLLMVGIFSCSPAKQLERAEQRVLANRESVERVGREWSKLHPCVPDSIIRYLPGLEKTNTIIQSDTIIQKDTVYITKTIQKTTLKRDTIEIVKRDNREIDLLKSDLEKEKSNNSIYQIKIAEQQAEIVKQTGRKNKWFWLLIVVTAGFAGWTFRKPIISLITKIPIK